MRFYLLIYAIVDIIRNPVEERLAQL